MRKIIITVVAVLVGAALVSCGGDPPPVPTGFAPGQTTEAYDYVHGGYVGQAIVSTNEDGSLSARLDEAFLPHTLAIVDLEDAQWTEDNTVFYVVRGNEYRVAKHIAYNGTNYTGVTVGTALAYVASDDQGNPSGGTILESAIIRNEATMKAWFDNIAGGGFQIFTELGGTPTPVTTTSYGSLFKRGSTYWNFGIGWQGNIEAMEEAVAQHGAAYSLDELVRGSDDRWRIADAVTGATLSDFKDYFALIQTAAGRLKME